MHIKYILSRSVLGIVTLLLLSPVAQARTAPMQQVFKCYLETNWKPQIGYFEWFAADSKKHIARLPGSKLPATPMSNYRKLYIKQVIECVHQDKEFASTRARRLEQESSDIE